MHILFLTDNFPPEVNAPASRTFEHCREWVRLGHQVTVITCAPNFPKGKVFDGYKNRLWQKEEVSGIKVIRVWSIITANQGFLLRIIDYVSYMVSAIFAAPFVKKVDVVIGTSPQFFTAVAAYVVSRYKRIPYVFELRDIWPESIRAVGAMKESKVLDWLEHLELFLYRKAELIVSVTQSFKKNLVSRGVSEEKIHVVTNGVDISRFSVREKDSELLEKLDLKGKFIAGYIGTHGMAHALHTILQAAEQIQSRPDGDQYRFIFLGDGAEKEALKNMAQEKLLNNVIFIDSVSKEEVVRYWSLLDVSIIHLRNTPLFTTVIPSKLFECMGMGIPVLHGVKGESADIVQKESVGIVFEPENLLELCDAMEKMKGDEQFYKQTQQNCLSAAKNNDRTVLAGDMLKAVEAIT